MSADFISLTALDSGRPIYIRKDLIAYVTEWNRKTSVMLTIDEVDVQVKETPEQVIRAIKGETHDLHTKRNDNAAPARAGRKPRTRRSATDGPDRVGGDTVQPLERAARPGDGGPAHVVRLDVPVRSQ